MLVLLFFLLGIILILASREKRYRLVISTFSVVLVLAVISFLYHARDTLPINL